MNRLKDATSPYLLQHADNPVHWFEWGQDAFDEARRRDVPLLISVGYSACHWCHVMAHESFEDEETATLMNEHFVNVKVDREERPDVDAVYMNATQAMTGHGGWPMTVFATPDGQPFYTGTYFPRPHFQRLLTGVSNAWNGDREAVLTQSGKIVEALSEHAAFPAGPLPTQEILTGAVRNLAASFDPGRGGFGDAPKFPPSMALEFLLRYGAAAGTPEAETALSMAGRTLETMARGGIYDQLGGGFARYSVDAEWVVPHFEKMLYDNALLLRVYTHWWRSTGSDLARRVALETASFLLAEMRTPEGGFASALDADSEGVEGKFYVWTVDELQELLGEEDGDWAAGVFEVTGAGTFEHGTSVLQLLSDPDDPARFERVRAALLQARSHRVRPGRDDKVVAAWNGLAIAALAETGALFDRPDLVEAARTAAVLLDELHIQDASGPGGLGNPDSAETAGVSGTVRLLRTSRDGRAGSNAGVLEDYADLAEGLLTLYGVTGETRWFQRADELLETVLTHFPDGSGGFFDTADDAERLFQRPQDPTDNATPSGQFAAAGALLSHAALTGSARHREAAEAALGTVSVLAARHARFAGWGLAVAQAAVSGPVEVAVVGPRDDPATAALHRTALSSTLPGLVVALGEPGLSSVPLLAGRGLVNGSPAAYVCRGFTCRLPVTTPAALEEELSRS
ncbi:thioredoxin domain-containing protein [Planobispora rosea]|uniref:Thioredoxin domain-containing protein n=1 Tax=Planobispora rosea TaxID=35762 RepID=A0A8J3S0Y8_PLARO|nr:thioredoxin domain-containing protein [Planobispora rosea]GGS66222.1 thioredoxin domain-containing protein [Planobispora rosea]GIH85013.1 thioredoxin domain-containing protein [Planobispora rosea]